MPLTDYYNQLRLTGNQGTQIPTVMTNNPGMNISPNNTGPNANTSTGFDPSSINTSILGYSVFGGGDLTGAAGTRNIGRNDPRFNDFAAILNPATSQEERQRLMSRYTSQPNTSSPTVAQPNASQPNTNQTGNALQNQYNPGQNRNMSGLVSHYRVTRGY